MAARQVLRVVFMLLLLIVMEGCMLVGTRMTRPVLSVSPALPINEALTMMRREHIRRLPIVEEGRLIGIVSERDLLNASPSPATSLSVWELNYLLSKVTVREVMSREVVWVTEDMPIEEAARLMVDKKIGGLPVLRDGYVVGMITETDLFKVFLELMGARQSGVRLSVMMSNTAGQLAQFTQAIAGAGGNIVALGTFAGEDVATSLVTCKVVGLSEAQVRACVGAGQPVIDMRMC